MYNPIDLSKKTEELVLRDNERKYYRFRSARFYGGIATADIVGCNLRCKFCWSGNSVWNAKNIGKFYSPEEVAQILLDIAESKGYQQVRISGGEPTIGRKHLIKILENINYDMVFILETNGILLGVDKKYVEELSKFKNIHIRVCLKGIDPEEFTFLTGAESGYNYQTKSLEYLRDSKINFNIALVTLKKDIDPFHYRLKDMDLDKIMIEKEEIKLYPQVKKRLQNEGLINYFK
jgi:uncharacterized Fe-S cluster-containing radical SAM superfamily protein